MSRPQHEGGNENPGAPLSALAVYGHDLEEEEEEEEGEKEEEEEDKVIISAWLKLIMTMPLKKRERTA